MNSIMKNTLLLILFFSMSVGSSYFAPVDGYEAFSVEGEMVCKVKSKYVVSIDEGIPKVWTGEKEDSPYSDDFDEFSKGDVLVFSYLVTPGGFGWSLEYKEKMLLAYQHLRGKSKADVKIGDNGISIYRRNLLSHVSFRSDWINIRDSGKSLYLERYYKGDWSGIYSVDPVRWAMSDEVATLDCRQASDKVDEFINKALELNKEIADEKTL